jgi:hypothetical protein
MMSFNIIAGVVGRRCFLVMWSVSARRPTEENLLLHGDRVGYEGDCATALCLGDNHSA